MGYQRYTKEFKDNAVKLCLQPDANRREISDNLGVKYKTICSWISKAMSNPSKEIKGSVLICHLYIVTPFSFIYKNSNNCIMH